MTFDVTMVGFVTGHGGDALQMLTLARGLQGRGLRVHILVPEHDASVKFAESCAAEGIHCTRTPQLAADQGGVRQSITGVARLIYASRSPILHFHSGNSCLPRVAMLSLELVRPRHAVATLQSPYETIVPGSWRARTWSALANRRLDAVISPSDHATRFQQLCGVDARRTYTIRNAIDTARFASGDAQVPRALLGLPDEARVILFASRLDPQKRPVDAVTMFGRVASQFPDTHLVFVGVGSEEQAVRQAAVEFGVQDRTHLVGYQTNIPDWLALASVYVLPTERENFSVAILEALAAGCALLSTDCPGNDEVLVDGQNSAVHSVGDVDTGTAQLSRLLTDAALRERVQQGAKETADRYSDEALTSSVFDLYTKVLGGPFRN